MYASDSGTAAGNLVAGRYQLVAPLGSGGTGTVWRSLDTLLQREVAVKEIGLSPEADEAMRAQAAQRTFREARAAARIRHPGVVAVYDVLSAEDHLYIVMELVEGRPLAEVISAQGPLSAARVAGIGGQLLAAVTAGHAAGVLHRDLKPANVLITPDGRAVLTDFGIASMAGDPSITRTGFVVGTPGYVAPERARGEPATPAADLWSLGATLYAAISGSGPFDHHGSAIATLYAVATQDAPPLAGGDQVHEMISALLRRDPRLRPTAAQAASAFGPPADKPVPLPQPAPRQSAPRPPSFPPEPLPRSRAFGVTLAAAAIVCLASALTVIVKSPGQIAPPSPSRDAAQVVVAPALSQGFRVAAGVNPDGSQELFARARDGRLMSGQLVSGAWSGWTALPSGSLRFSGAPAVAVGPDHRLHVFARATTGRLAEFWQPGPGTRSLTGPAVLSARLISGDPAAVALPDGRLEVFAPMHGASAATLGEITQTGTAGAGTWSAWTSLAGHLAAPPVVVITSGGDPEVFAPGPDRGLGYDIYRGGAWSGWRALPGGKIFTGTPAVGVNFDGRLEVFSRTTSGTLVHSWELPHGTAAWGGPLPLGLAVRSDPAVVTVQGRIDVFATAMDGVVVHAGQLTAAAGTGWSQPVPIGGSSAGVPVPVLAGSQEEVFARTASGSVAWSHLLPSGGWSAWQSLGGTF